MERYLIIESKKNIKSDESLMMSVFSEFIRILHAEVNDKSIILKYQEETEVSFSDIILNIMSDTLSDLRIYESHVFEHPEELEKHQKWILKLIQSIPFNKYVYLNDKIILMYLLPNIDLETKSMILRKYHHDALMLETIKTYLESNQNMIAASKHLYVHRNTLIQRLDKFHQITGFDVRVFQDAYLIYQLIR
jgi:sugar diacid utilization regulator